MMWLLSLIVGPQTRKLVGNVLGAGVLMLLLASCGGLSPLKLLTGGGGPNVAANIQAGKTNTQTVGQTNNVSPTVHLRPDAKVESIDQSSDTVVKQELPTWVWIVGIILFIMGWVTDTPSTYLRNMYPRKKGR